MNTQFDNLIATCQLFNGNCTIISTVTLIENHKGIGHFSQIPL